MQLPKGSRRRTLAAPVQKRIGRVGGVTAILICGTLCRMVKKSLRCVECDLVPQRYRPYVDLSCLNAMHT